MFLLQTSVFGDHWNTIVQARTEKEIEEKRDRVKILPITLTRVARKCSHCGEEVEANQLKEFDNPSICPSCKKTWDN